LRHVAKVFARDVNLPIQEPIERLLYARNFLLRENIVKGSAPVSVEALYLFRRQYVFVRRNSTIGPGRSVAATGTTSTGCRSIALNGQSKDQDYENIDKEMGLHHGIHWLIWVAVIETCLPY